MKKSLLFAGMLLFGSHFAFAQNYFILSKTGTETGYNYAQSGTGVTTSLTSSGTTKNEVLSNAINLPFAWKFFNEPVTQYKVSDNGYITFDVTQTVSNPNNEALPSANAPKNAIFAFWDDLKLETMNYQGTNYLATTNSYTYGTNGNRVHVIAWRVASQAGVPATINNFSYFAIRIFEKGGFDVVHNYSDLPAMSGTIGAQNADGTIGVSWAGSPSLAAPNNVALDYTGQAMDKVFEFNFGTQPETDMAILTIATPNHIKATGPNKIDGFIANYGSQPVTNFTLNYQLDNGTVRTMDITGKNISANGGTFYYDHATQWNDGTVGQQYNLKVWASNINGKADEVTANDAQEKKVMPNNGTFTTRRVLFEEGSGAWCGWCPDGHVTMKNIQQTYPLPGVIGVIHHNGDGMTNTESNTINSTYATGYPFAMADRFLFPGATSLALGGRNVWESRVSERINMPTPMKVHVVNKSWDASTRQIKFDVQVEAVDFWAGDFRVFAYITEDNVRGANTNQWNQANYMSKEQNPNGLLGPNHPMFNYPKSIAGYKHQHVVRAIPSTSNGVSGIIPAIAKPGETYTKSFTYTLPAETQVSYTGLEEKDDALFSTRPGAGMNKADDIHLVAFVAAYDASPLHREVINAHAVPLTSWYSAVEDQKPGNDLNVKVYPNPSNGMTYVQYNMPVTAQGTVDLYNSVGQKVATLRDGMMASGEQMLSFDGSAYGDGIYFIQINAGGYRTTERVVIMK